MPSPPPPPQPPPPPDDYTSEIRITIHDDISEPDDNSCATPLLTSFTREVTPEDDTLFEFRVTINDDTCDQGHKSDQDDNTCGTTLLTSFTPVAIPKSPLPADLYLRRGINITVETEYEEDSTKKYRQVIAGCNLPDELVALVMSSKYVEVFQLTKHFITIGKIFDIIRKMYDVIHVFMGDLCEAQGCYQDLYELNELTCCLSQVDTAQKLDEIIDNLPALFEHTVVSEVINDFTEQLCDTFGELPKNFPHFKKLWKIASKLEDYAVIGEDMLEINKHRAFTVMETSG